MSKYSDYKKEIRNRASLGLNPKPISGRNLLIEIIEQIKNLNHPERDASLQFLIYNVAPGTTGAASVKAKFLKDIIGVPRAKDSRTQFGIPSHLEGRRK